MTKKAIRQEREKALQKENKDLSFPGWEAVEAERLEEEPKVWLTVKDQNGDVVRRIEGPVKKGFHRVAWDLRHSAPSAIDLNNDYSSSSDRGLMAAPGTYTVILSKQLGAVVTDLSEPRTFEVVPLREGALKGASPAEVASFWRKYEGAVGAKTALQLRLKKNIKKVEAMKTALVRSKAPAGDLDERLSNLRMDLLALDVQLNGDRTKSGPGEKSNPTIGNRLSAVSRGVDGSTYGPTATHERMLEIANEEMEVIKGKLEAMKNKTAELEEALEKAGAPWME